MTIHQALEKIGLTTNETKVYLALIDLGTSLAGNIARKARFHDLRHTFASKLMMNGADIGSVQKLLGHKDITMTMRYSHLSNAHLRETVKKLEVGTDLAQEPLRKTGVPRKALRNNGRYAT